jgi:hypothetical protein
VRVVLALWVMLMRCPGRDAPLSRHDADATGWAGRGRLGPDSHLGECALGEDTVFDISIAMAVGCAARGAYINKQVLPQAPSPTITNFRRISAMVVSVRFEGGKDGKLLLLGRNQTV